jgi:hypothetical protein
VFPFLALLCFLLALFGAHIGTVDLVLLGWVFFAFTLLFGNWPMAIVTARFGRGNTQA